MTTELPPYPEYKASGVPWLGDVPAHWQQLPGRACYQEKKIPNAGLRETTVLSLSYGQIVVKPPEKLFGLVPASFETYQIVEPGDIIARPTDLQNDWNSLRFGLNHHSGIITSAYMCLRTQPAVLREYGHLLLHAYDLKKVFYGLGSGLRQNLDWRDFKYLPCLVPPRDEQQAIVRYLDHIDQRIRRYIRAKQRLLALLHEQKQAIIHQAVTRGLDASAPLKPSGVAWLGEVPAHWEVKALKYAFQSMDYGISATATDKGKIPLLTMGNIKDGKVVVPDNGGVESVDEHYLLQDGDLLYNRTNSAELVGKVGLFRDDKRSKVTFASYLVRLKPLAENDSAFLNYLLNSPTILGVARQLAVPSLHQSNLNPTRYGRIQVAIPPVGEQRQIVNHLQGATTDLERAVTATELQIDLIREYRTRLIADVVTGKVDVRAAAGALPAEVREEEAWAASEVEEDGEEGSEEELQRMQTENG